MPLCKSHNLKKVNNSTFHFLLAHDDLGTKLREKLVDRCMRLVRKQIKSTISNENLDTSSVLHNIFRIATGKYVDYIQTVAQSSGPFL